MNLRAIAQSALDEDAAAQNLGGEPLRSPKNPDFESKHKRGKPGNRGQFAPSEKTLAKRDQSDVIPSPDGQTAFGQSFSSEYAAVEAKYKGTPQWMKAPNSEPTNLSERQWVQVRTPSFKAWFGDWENDPENASKVIDSNGEPMVVYHETDWRPSKRNSAFKSQKSLYDGLFYFSNHPSRPGLELGENRLELFLNIRQPEIKNSKIYEGFFAYDRDKFDGVINTFSRRTKYENGRRVPGEWEDFDGAVFGVMDPTQIKSATSNSGAFSPDKESIFDSAPCLAPAGTSAGSHRPSKGKDPAMSLKQIAALAIAEDAAQDSVLDIALEYLSNEPTPPPRCRFPKVKMAFEVRGKSAATPVEDAKPTTTLSDPKRPYQTLNDSTPPLTDLQRHDRRFHPNGYKKGDACKYRETLAKTDNADDLSAAERDEHKSKYGNLSIKKRDEYFRLMTKKHPEIDAEATLSEIGKITDPKVQKDAFAWVMRGAIKLPEDLYKVEQARELAGKAKKDPMSYDTPQACINELLGEGHKISLKPITVEELKKDPLFSDYQKLPYGVETFQVEDSKAGQKRMREVLDTHWGEDANPWCLLARTAVRVPSIPDLVIWWVEEATEEQRKKVGDWDRMSSPDNDWLLRAYKEKYGHEADGLHSAWNYWNHYNALPKRVAFKDGKILAFMATHAMDEDEAFDDAAYSSASKLAEMYPDEFTEYEEWTETEEGQEEGANFYEWLEHNYPELTGEEGLREHTTEEWWDRQDSPHHGIPVGFAPAEGDEFGRWAYFEIRDGKPVPISFSGEKWRNGDNNDKDGYTAWYDNGQKKEEYRNGQRQEWHEDGSPKHIESEGLSASFYENGSPYFLQNHPSSPSSPVRDPLAVLLFQNGTWDQITYHADGPNGERAATIINFDTSGKPVKTGSKIPPYSTFGASVKKLVPMASDLISKAKQEYSARKAPAQDSAAPSSPRSPAFDEAKFRRFLAGSQN